MNDSSKKTLVVLIIGIIIVGILYLCLNKIFNKKNEDVFLKNYKVNEYIPMYISDQSKAEIYLSDYTKIMHSDINAAYNLLDSSYREKKFGNIASFENYVYNLRASVYKVDKYYIKTEGKYEIIGVYDNNGNLFIFKTNGVMQYNVLFDETTVEI